MQSQTYDIKCPRCGQHAVAMMKENGVRGTYRELMVDWVAERVTCLHCGFNRRSAEPIPYELWYRVMVGGQIAWATNRSHAHLLVSYLLNRSSSTEIDSSSIEILPAWMLDPNNRVLIGTKLERMLQRD